MENTMINNGRLLILFLILNNAEGSYKIFNADEDNLMEHKTQQVGLLGYKQIQAYNLNIISILILTPPYYLLSFVNTDEFKTDKSPGPLFNNMCSMLCDWYANEY